MKTIKVIESIYYNRIGEMTKNKESELFLSSIERGALQSSIAIGKNNFMIVISIIGREKRYYSFIDTKRIINRLKQKIKTGKGQRIEKLKSISDLTDERINVLETKDDSFVLMDKRRGISVQFKKRTRTKDKIKSLEIIHRKIGEIIRAEIWWGNITIKSIPSSLLIDKKFQETAKILKSKKAVNSKQRIYRLMGTMIPYLILTAVILNKAALELQKIKFKDNRSNNAIKEQLEE